MTAKGSNPFTPGSVLDDPNVFSGRNQQLLFGARMLTETRDMRARHTLVTGRIGIGKSSFASQIKGIARGESDYLQLLPEDHRGLKLNFVVAKHRVLKGEDVVDIVNALLAELNRVCKMDPGLSVKEATFDFKFLKFDVKEGKPVPPGLVASFVNHVEEVWKKCQKSYNGILFIIDELDQATKKPGLATFFKNVTELMTDRKLYKVVLMPVGLQGVEDELEAEHESAPRIFDYIEIPLLEKKEVREVISGALGKTPVSIVPAVVEEIIHLSGRFPNQVHLVGRACFDATTDNIIDREDLKEGLQAVLRGKDQARLMTLLKAVATGGTREVVDAMARDGGKEMTTSAITQAMGKTKSSSISPYLTTLVERGVIKRNERSYYSFTDPLFSPYVRVDLGEASLP